MDAPCQHSPGPLLCGYHVPLGAAQMLRCPRTLALPFHRGRCKLEPVRATEGGEQSGEAMTTGKRYWGAQRKTGRKRSRGKMKERWKDEREIERERKKGQNERTRKEDENEIDCKSRKEENKRKKRENTQKTETEKYIDIHKHGREQLCEHGHA